MGLTQELIVLLQHILYLTEPLGSQEIVIFNLSYGYAINDEIFSSTDKRDPTELTENHTQIIAKPVLR